MEVEVEGVLNHSDDVGGVGALGLGTCLEGNSFFYSRRDSVRGVFRNRMREIPHICEGKSAYCYRP